MLGTQGGREATYLQGTYLPTRVYTPLYHPGYTTTSYHTRPCYTGVVGPAAVSAQRPWAQRGETHGYGPLFLPKVLKSVESGGSTLRLVTPLFLGEN